MKDKIKIKKRSLLAGFRGKNHEIRIFGEVSSRQASHRACPTIYTFDICQLHRTLNQKVDPALMLMIPNPGGQLAPDHIVGREELIRKMWSILDGRGIYMNDLRRVGKTMILEKMAARQPELWACRGPHHLFAMTAERVQNPSRGLRSRSQNWTGE